MEGGCLAEERRESVDEIYALNSKVDKNTHGLRGIFFSWRLQSTTVPTSTQLGSSLLYILDLVYFLLIFLNSATLDGLCKSIHFRLLELSRTDSPLKKEV